MVTPDGVAEDPRLPAWPSWWPRRSATVDAPARRCRATGRRPARCMGTLEYMSPEQASRRARSTTAPTSSRSEPDPARDGDGPSLVPPRHAGPGAGGRDRARPRAAGPAAPDVPRRPGVAGRALPPEGPARAGSRETDEPRPAEAGGPLAGRVRAARRSKPARDHAAAARAQWRCCRRRPRASVSRSITSRRTTRCRSYDEAGSRPMHPPSGKLTGMELVATRRRGAVGSRSSTCRVYRREGADGRATRARRPATRCCARRSAHFSGLLHHRRGDVLDRGPSSRSGWRSGARRAGRCRRSSTVGRAVVTLWRRCRYGGPPALAIEPAREAQGAAGGTLPDSPVAQEAGARARRSSSRRGRDGCRGCIADVDGILKRDEADLAARQADLEEQTVRATSAPPWPRRSRDAHARWSAPTCAGGPAAVRARSSRCCVGREEAIAKGGARARAAARAARSGRAPAEAAPPGPVAAGAASACLDVPELSSRLQFIPAVWTPGKRWSRSRPSGGRRRR